MIALLSAYALLAAAVPAPVTVNVDLKSGDTVTGQRSIRVTVIATNPVTQVEFYVASELRDNATSTPYMFQLDSLGENDGDLKLRFKAYTTEGETGDKTVLVHIDNGVSKGAAYHVQKGLAFLTNSDWANAETEGRIALKADPNSNPARIVLTRAYLGDHTYDKAQKYAEEAVAQDGNDMQALNLLAAVNIERALNLVVKSGTDRADFERSQRDALKSAIDARRKVLDTMIDKAPASTPATKLAQMAIDTGRYALAEQTLLPVVRAGGAAIEVSDKLAFVQLRLSQFTDALVTLNDAKRNAPLDAAGNAIAAICYAEGNKTDFSDDAMKTAIQLGPDNATVRTAQAYLALKFAHVNGGRETVLALNYDDDTSKSNQQKQDARTAQQAALVPLQNELGNRTETYYFVQSLENQLENYEAARKAFETAVLIEPANADAFIEQGNRSIALSFRQKLDKDAKDAVYADAETMYLAALDAAPSSAAALSGLAIVNTLQNRVEDAVKWGEASVAANKNYAAGYVAVGTAYKIASTVKREQADAIRRKNGDIGLSGADRQANEEMARALEADANKLAREARDAGLTAATLDPRIEGYSLTDASAAWRYFQAGGRLPVIVPPSP